MNLFNVETPLNSKSSSSIITRTGANGGTFQKAMAFFNYCSTTNHLKQIHACIRKKKLEYSNCTICPYFYPIGKKQLQFLIH